MPTARATLSLHGIKRFNIRVDVPVDRLGQGEIATLHGALRKMKLNVDATEVGRRQFGPTTVAAIKAFQCSHG